MSVTHAFMPSSHLACNESTEPVACPKPPYRAASMWRPAASVQQQAEAVRFSYRFTGAVASMIFF